MERKIRVVQYGCGKMSKYIMRYCFEKNVDVVGAIDINPDIIGKDISEVIGDGINKGVLISPKEDSEKLLSSLKPDVCIVTTMSLLEDCGEILKLCASLGINAITTCEEAFFASNSNPKLWSEINELAKKNDCTIAGSGYQDIYWGELISALAASTHKITKIIGESWYNVEDYGIALAKAHGAGLTLEEFERDVASSDNISNEERQKIIDSGNYQPSYMWNVNGWLASKLGLHVKNQTQKCIPEVYEEDINSTTLDMTIKKGMATGMSAVVTTETLEGITLETKCVGKVYAPSEFDKNEWTVIGEPETTLVINRPNTVELTCATIVNRLPDVINARSGFISTDKMDELKYRVKPLNEYVNEIPII